MQELLFAELAKKSLSDFPDTRYQGSKLKVLSWIWQHIEKLEFTSALDAFGGTGSVAYLLKTQGKQVAYNDILRFNYFIGKALIENSEITVDNEEIEYLLKRHRKVKYREFVASNFQNIYFTPEENEWIDTVAQNIQTIQDVYKQAIAFFALFQSCIIKRPYNLFHRKNLYIRFQDVERSFGNKTTWDTPFEHHFRNFIKQANSAVFDNKQKNIVLNKDAVTIRNEYDLIYIDTPYLNSEGTGVDYLGFYHFLEGLTDYANWENLIDNKYKHKPLKHDKSEWTDKSKIVKAFHALFQHFKDSILVVSYRSDGIPSEKELYAIMKEYKSEVLMHKYGKYKYVLSKNHHSEELLLIGI
jgi:adenine-specific DNA methylase